MFSVPMTLHEQNDCYFSQHCHFFTGCTTARKMRQPDLQSAMCPIEHSENLPVPKPPDQQMQISSNAD